MKTCNDLWQEYGDGGRAWLDAHPDRVHDFKHGRITLDEARNNRLGAGAVEVDGTWFIARSDRHGFDDQAGTIFPAAPAPDGMCWAIPDGYDYDGPPALVAVKESVLP